MIKDVALSYLKIKYLKNNICRTNENKFVTVSEIIFYVKETIYLKY